MIGVSRAEWGALQPKKSPTHLHQSHQRGIAVHHSGASSERKGSHSDCPGVVRGIQRFHQQDRGWNDIAYTWLACQHGYLFEGRGLGVRTAAQGTDAGNDSWHAVCWLGDGASFSLDPGNVDPLQAAISLTRSWHPGARLVWPHLRFHSTTCPGGALRQWCRQFPD